MSLQPIANISKFLEQAKAFQLVSESGGSSGQISWFISYSFHQQIFDFIDFDLQFSIVFQDTAIEWYQECLCEPRDSVRTLICIV